MPSPWYSITSLLQPFSPGITCVQVMPELDVRLVQLPTQENFLAADDGREINQSAVQVLDLDLAPVKFQQGILDVRQGFHPLVDQVAAQVAPCLEHPAQALVV